MYGAARLALIERLPAALCEIHTGKKEPASKGGLNLWREEGGEVALKRRGVICLPACSGSGRL
jgi:hypothetical protein